MRRRNQSLTLQTSAANPPSGEGGSHRRVWVFRAVAVLFPFCAVALANIVLYWADIGVDTSLVVSNDRVGDGVFYLNPNCDLAYCKQDLRGPEPRAFELPKRPETYRILVVGASSVQGYPYPSELAFPRQTQLVLSRQLRGWDVEVLNAGVVGLSTTPLVDIVRQSIDASPDLIVLYAGHNEFYGVGGVATKAPLTRLGIRCRRFRLGQLLTDCFSSDGPASGELITRLPTDVAIPVNSELVARAEEQYEKNLNEIAGICSRNKIPLLICSVVSNLGDHSPLPSPYPPSVGPADRERAEALEAQASDAISQMRYTEAIEPLAAVAHLTPNRAETLYWLARCLDQAGRKDEARRYFTRARDLDGFRYRAPSSFQRIAREVASKGQDAGIQFVDLVPGFARASEHGVPGHGLFLEHVHFSLEGHWLVARTLAKAIVERIRGDAWNEGAMPTVEERDMWLGVTKEDRIVATKLATFLLEGPPFDKSVDSKRQRQSLAAKTEGLLDGLSQEDRQAFESLDPKTKIDDLVDGLGRVHLSKGELECALAYFALGGRRRPWMPNSFVFAAIAHHLLGHDKEAVEDAERSFHTPMPETGPLRIERNALLHEIRLMAGR